MACGTQELTIQKGKTFSRIVRWETQPLVYKAISGITQAAPVVITATGHGVPDGWKVAVASVLGMTEINAENAPPRSSDFQVATKLTSDTLSLNKVNSAEFGAYVSGGYLVYYTPHTLASYTARMTIKNRVGGTTLLSLTTENSRILIDDTAKTITLSVSATDTAAITWTEGVYDLEVVSNDGVVTALLSGAVYVTEEVTT